MNPTLKSNKTNMVGLLSNIIQMRYLARTLFIEWGVGLEWNGEERAGFLDLTKDFPRPVLIYTWPSIVILFPLMGVFTLPPSVFTVKCNVLRIQQDRRCGGTIST